MPITHEIPLPNLLPMIHLPLIDPPLTPTRQRAPRARPVEILALIWSLRVRTVLQTRVPRGEVVRPFFGGGGEVRVPDEVWAVDGSLLGGCFAGWGGWGKSSQLSRCERVHQGCGRGTLVVDFQSFALRGGHVRRMVWRLLVRRRLRFIVCCGKRLLDCHDAGWVGLRWVLKIRSQALQEENIIWQDK